MNFLMAREQAHISHQGGNRLPRTMFAVGDFKQSIYSFQGADPLVMSHNRSDLSNRAKAIQADFRDVPLSVSFQVGKPYSGSGQ